MRSLLLILVATASIVATAPAADGDRGGQRQELQRNRTLWAHQHIRNYRFRLRVRCFCPSARHSVIVTVRDGRPHGATGFQRQLDTFPEMFAAIGRALDDPKAGTVTVRYNARRGFPAHRVDRPDQRTWSTTRSAGPPIASRGFGRADRGARTCVFKLEAP
jgi:hypothetical protein